MTDEQLIDWEHLEPDYRAGVLSLRYLSAKYGCSLGAITRRAKRDGWRRVLVEQVETKVTRENSPREHLTGENTGREHPEAATAGENGAGENTQKENSKKNTGENTEAPADYGFEDEKNEKENTGENSKTGCSLTVDPEREQPSPRDVLTLGAEHRAARHRLLTHRAHCRASRSGRTCETCTELLQQRNTAEQELDHAQHSR